MTMISNPAGVDDIVLWGNITITVADAIQAASTVALTAYRHYGIADLGEAEPALRDEIRFEIQTCLKQLGIFDLVQEWWLSLE